KEKFFHPFLRRGLGGGWAGGRICSDYLHLLKQHLPSSTSQFKEKFFHPFLRRGLGGGRAKGRMGWGQDFFRLPSST
ncbi:MAG: hypothetical protein ACOH2V_13960, partial [Candidatus Saccharimonadaceae bacterium]